ncbi:hypothetical protein [Metapseudomonas otitidis]|uniref:hypothetical protein n=1 Tax=Metapseudomonas otitidis TaxID=319939 RepID=UPI001CA3E255|nr:hypothetical protein [Pseudomonas otitidis]QZX85323.1 hypothetical protein K6751_11675 [Pseudomonas otitidis]
MDRNLAAIVRHERAAQENRKLTTAIGKEIAACPVSVELSDWNLHHARRKELSTDEGLAKTHLWQALNHREPSSCGHGEVRLREDEIDDYLAEDPACEQCRRAWALIQQRKVVRQELGRAKRAIRAIGRAALSKVNTHE